MMDKEKKSVPSDPCDKPPQSPAKETEGTGYPLQPGPWEGVYFEPSSEDKPTGSS